MYKILAICATCNTVPHFLIDMEFKPVEPCVYVEREFKSTDPSVCWFEALFNCRAEILKRPGYLYWLECRQVKS